MIPRAAHSRCSRYLGSARRLRHLAKQPFSIRVYYMSAPGGHEPGSGGRRAVIAGMGKHIFMSRLWVWDGECGGLIGFYKPAVVGFNSAML